MPRWPRIGIAAAGAVVSVLMLSRIVYPSDLKADWRSAAVQLNRLDPSGTVGIVPADPRLSAEVETARYYLGPAHRVIAIALDTDDLVSGDAAAWLAVGLKDGKPVDVAAGGVPDEDRVEAVINVPGLRLFKLKPHSEGR